MSKNVHGFREWKGIDLCSDCYHQTPEIHHEVHVLRMNFIGFLVHRGQVDCALCLRALICPITWVSFRHHELDHYDRSTKVDSIGTMIMKGCSLSSICQESLKCRLLCVRCHARVTYAQRCVGTMRLPVTSDEFRHQAASIVEQVVRKIMIIDANRV